MAGGKSFLRGFALLCVCAFAVSAAFAQGGGAEPKPAAPKAPPAGPPSQAKAPATADEATAALLDAMDAKAYVAGSDGVNTATLRGMIKMTNKAMPGPLESDIEFTWDGSAQPAKSQLKFKSPQLQAMGQQMQLGDILTDLFRHEPWREAFAGSKFTSLTKDGVTRIVADGENAEGVRSMTLDANGLPSEMAIEQGAPGSPQKQKRAGKITYAEFDGKFARQSMNMQFDSPEGKMDMNLTHEYVAQADAHVISKVVMAVKANMGAQGTMEVMKMEIAFNEFFVNQPAPAPAPKEAPPKQPATQPKGGK